MKGWWSHIQGALICSDTYNTLNSFHTYVFFLFTTFTARGAQWLSGRASDSEARGREFETYLRRVVPLSKTLNSPKVLVIHRRWWFHPDMTEKLMTWTLSLNTNKTKPSLQSAKELDGGCVSVLGPTNIYGHTETGPQFLVSSKNWGSPGSNSHPLVNKVSTSWRTCLWKTSFVLNYKIWS